MTFSDRFYDSFFKATKPVVYDGHDIIIIVVVAAAGDVAEGSG